MTVFILTMMFAYKAGFISTQEYTGEASCGAAKEVFLEAVKARYMFAKSFCLPK